MGRYSCMICDDKVAARAINEELSRGMSGAAVARLMTLRGFEVTAPTVNEHAKHRPAEPPPDAGLRGRDAAIFVRDKQMSALETLIAKPDNEMAILAKDLQPAVKTLLTAQRDLDKRISKTNDQKTQIAMAMILSGAAGGLAAIPEPLRLGDGAIEGEFTEVSDESS